MTDEVIEVTDKELFDQAVATETPAETKEEAPAPAEATTEEKPDRTRDELGRFAPKEEPKAAAPKIEAPKVEAVKPEPKEEVHRVPLKELLDTRERAQRAEARLQEIERHLAYQTQQRRQQQPQQPEVTIFDNPDQYLAQRVIGPMQQWGQMMVMQNKDQLSREMANQHLGEQVVNEALAYMAQVRQTPEGQFAYHQIMTSGHPYGQLVKWHQEQKMRQEIGSDPKAYRQKLLDEAKKDPNFQAEIVKLVREQQTSSGRPSVVSLPPSLSSVPAAASNSDDRGDLSDRALYAFATK